MAVSEIFVLLGRKNKEGMQRYFIEMAYNGSRYNGWQIQPDAPSVQEAVERALSLTLRENIRVTGAGRTDTGVHASFYVAHFETDAPTGDAARLCHRLNCLLGDDVAIRDIYPVRADAHARFSALSRTYKYYLDKAKNPFTHEYAWRTWPLPDVGAMNEACAALMEYRDFTSFAKLHSDTRTNLCRVMEARWEDTGTQLVFTIKADRFLRNMVRAIVGTLLEVGRGRLSVEEFRRIIERRDRCAAGVSVPGKALFLCDIEYPDCRI